MVEDDQKCIVCNTSEEDDSNYLNTRMKFLISKCGHRFCDQCIQREFQHKREISCPKCSKMIRKSQLQDKTLEELAYTKELSIRKKVLKDYNKTEDDFDTLEEFNDYLESVEDLIFALVHGEEFEKEVAQKQWKEYRQEHTIEIATNDARKAEEERRISHLIQEQQRENEERRMLQLKEDAQHDADVKKHKEQMMEVALGERDQSEVISVGGPNTAALTAEMHAAMMGFQPGVITGPQPEPVAGGKKAPAVAIAHESKQLRKRQQKAGGYDPQTQFSRNKAEAWCGLRVLAV